MTSYDQWKDPTDYSDDPVSECPYLVDYVKDGKLCQAGPYRTYVEADEARWNIYLGSGVTKADVTTR